MRWHKQKPKPRKKPRKLNGKVRYGVLNGNKITWTGKSLEQARGYCPLEITRPSHFYPNGRCRCRKYWQEPQGR